MYEMCNVEVVGSVEVVCLVMFFFFVLDEVEEIYFVSG